MEISNLLHMGVNTVINALMVYSASPIARKLVEKVLITDDPYHINIELNAESTNRNVEILNAYLKTMGLKLTFKRVPKKGIEVFEPIEVMEEITKSKDTVMPMEKMTGNEVKAFIEMIDEYVNEGSNTEKAMTIDIMDEMYEWEVEKLLETDDIMTEIDSLSCYNIIDAVEKESNNDKRDIINFFASNIN